MGKLLALGVMVLACGAPAEDEAEESWDTAGAVPLQECMSIGPEPGAVPGPCTGMAAAPPAPPCVETPEAPCKKPATHVPVVPR